jgi:hypothetical protein
LLRHDASLSTDANVVDPAIGGTSDDAGSAMIQR